MLRATFTSLLARKMRLLMSAMAIILGTAFVAGSLMFTDTLGRTFDGIMDGSVGDVVVTPKQEGSLVVADATIPGSQIERFADLPGAARADGQITMLGVFVVGENGKVVGGQGAPAFAFNYSDGPNQNGDPGLRITSGRPPKGEHEVAVDPKTAERAGYQIGDEVPLVSAGPIPRITATMVGVVEFGGSLAGASIVTMDTPAMQHYFLGGKDAYTGVWLTTQDGTSQQQLADAAAKIVPAGFVAKAGADVAKDGQDEIQQGLSFITTFLLVFAGIALFVGSFLIINTFGILVAQRGRELALLRAIGAGRNQVTRSVLLEAIIVGLVGSTLGLLLGVVLAQGIRALFATLGLDLSDAGLVLRPRTVLAVYLVGVLVTMLAAWIPARRAGRTAPVAAMREDAEQGSGRGRVGLALKSAVLLLGLLAFLAGLFVVDSRQIWWIGAGIVGLVLGTAFLAPLVGRPVIAGLGWVYRRLFGTVGHMAEQNAVRNPGRTAATASALMIGMTLVSLMGVVSQSTKASVDAQIEKTFRADYILSNAIGQPFSATLSEEAAKVDGVRAVSPVRFVQASVADEDVTGVAIDPATFADVERIEVSQGTADLDARSVIVSEDALGGRRVGDEVPVELGARTEKFRIAGVYDELQTMGSPDYIFSTDGAERVGAPKADHWAFLFVDPGADKAAVRKDVEAVVADQPLVTLKDQASYAEEQRAQINQLLYLIYALLGLAIVIAVLGIVNTLGLSVLERTREIGLLRAVGLSRAQLRRMIRLESVAIALLGALLGIVLGVVAGVAIQRSLADDGITELAIPWLSLLVFVVLAGVVGVLAALLPARRAARLDVLRAISTE